MSVGTIMAFAVSAILVENLVLVQFLGICPFLGVSKRTDTAVGMGAAVVLIITLSSAITWLIYNFLLKPFELDYLRTLTFALVIATLVQLVELIMRKLMPAVHRALGIYLPLITTNCAVLGIAIMNINKGYSFGMSIINGFFSSIGFMLAMLIFSIVRERLERCDVPRPFKGYPIVLITAALLSIAFMGFNGIKF